MQSSDADIDLDTQDLGPLAWVLDELRKSLESAASALRRFVRDANAARGNDMGALDPGHLRIARQQLHQAVGALEMVGLAVPAQVLRSMEAAVQRFVQKPELCNEANAAKVERAGFALTEYLEGVLLGKNLTPVALFPQYRDTQELAGADRVHPADLWPQEWRWNEPIGPEGGESLSYDPSLRSRMDQAVLKIIKSADPQAAADMARLSSAIASGQEARQPRIFWRICAGYFQALAAGLLQPDVYVKRAASRILIQYASLAKGDLGVSDRLAQDLVFFCAQAAPAQPADAPALAAVRLAWGLARHQPVDYLTSQYGHFDPVLLAQARKRITAAKDSWSALSGGDATKLRFVADQFNLVGDSLTKLHPPSAPLAQALTRTIDSLMRTGQPPAAELAMEVATAVLYLEAAFQDLDPANPELEQRTLRLAQRLDAVRQGGAPESLEPWMEELYRRVSDRQTMGSVVGELRGTLSELEKLLDQFFRHPADKTPLRDAPGHLAQMRGVLSVLGLDVAARAVGRMRESVEEIITTELDEERARTAGTFDRLGNNLGALGFLIDMLNYQPALAKKLFVYDDATGELRPLMGRTGEPAPPTEADLEIASPPAEGLAQEIRSLASGAADAAISQQFTVRLDQLAAQAVLAEQPAIAQSARQAAAAVSANDADAAAAVLSDLADRLQPPGPAEPAPAPVADIEEDDLQDIFLEEAREVVGNGLAAVAQLADNPEDSGALTTLRRSFHTLKGSSRMVGLSEFGEAAWAMEQVLNTWLADQKPANEALRSLSRDALAGFGRWVDGVATNNDSAWKASMFRGPADALRLSDTLQPLRLPGAAEAAPPAPAQPSYEATQVLSVPVAPAVSAFEATQVLTAPAVPADVSFESTQVMNLPPAAEPPAPAPAEPDFSFELDMGATEPSAAPAPVPAAPAEAPANEFVELDFDSLELPAEAAPAAEPAVVTPAEPASTVSFDFDLPDAAPAAEPESAPEPEPAPVLTTDFDLGEGTVEIIELDAPAEAASAPAPEAPAAPELPADEPAEDPVKVIGDLRIGIPLYNVYLNEADEWSRHLVTELAEWSLELNRPVPASTVGLAHALAGSSATVGFHALSEIARALERAMDSTKTLSFVQPAHGKAFTDAADEIRRLLHQFAAGFLKQADPSVIEALHGLRTLDIPKRADLTLVVSAGTRIAEPPAPAPAADEPVPEPAAEAPAAPEPVVAVEPPPVVVAEAVSVTVAEPSQAPAAPHTLTRGPDHFDDGQDDIDVVDVVDADLFPIFEEEANELLPQLGSALRQWVQTPNRRESRDEVLRVLHTLKGSARLAGALRLGEMAHRTESEVEGLFPDHTSASQVEPLLARFDAMQTVFERLREIDQAQVAGVIEGDLPMADVPAPPSALEPVAAAEPVSDASGTSPGVQAAPAAPQPAPVRAPLRPAALLAVPRASSNQAVRVRSQLLDRLVNQAGEVMITRSRLEAHLGTLRSSLADLTGNLDKLRGQLRDIELQAESQMQSRLALAKDSAANFDPLEFDRFTRVQELTRMMAESVNDVATVQRNLQRAVEGTEDDLVAQGRQTRDLQRDLLRTRMVEFDGIADRLYRVVRLSSKESGKQVKLDITGGTIEMDRGVLDRMTPAFEHLLRNCVAHGIESPERRLEAGKESTGSVAIRLTQEGNDVSVEFADDGAGLDVARIREKALAQGLISPDQTVSEADAANLIFLPGFSTATEVTELSGRGIGMDVVRSEVNALGGRIETSTTSGKGSRFKLVLPLTTAVTQVVMIRAGQLSVGAPANLVEIVRRSTPAEISRAYETGVFEFGGESLPFYWAGSLLQGSARSTEPVAKTIPVVIFRSAAQRVAVHVDEVLGNQEVVVKNLGPQLARLPGLAGMTVLASGAVVLIYNPVALSAVYGEQARAASAQAVEVAAPVVPEAPVDASRAAGIPLILVVDDSITVRRVTQRLLQREGYRVALANDGLQAIERLAEELPAVVLSDIEMPRMDGFDLARNIRSDLRTAKLPVVMITSRIAEKHRDHAAELGVNHYLGKPYSEEELLSLLRRYTGVAATA